jgi:hypothetical protein
LYGQIGNGGLGQLPTLVDQDHVVAVEMTRCSGLIGSAARCLVVEPNVGGVDRISVNGQPNRLALARWHRSQLDRDPPLPVDRKAHAGLIAS